MKYLYSIVYGISTAILLSSCAGNLISKKILKDESLKNIASNPDYEVQIIYTTVNKNNKSFTSHTYNVVDDKYFYPASTVKLPVAILALQKLNEINAELNKDINIHDEMLTAAMKPNQTPAFVDTTTATKKPSVGRYIERIFTLSDNNAYNRLYELLGPDYINQIIRSKGLSGKSTINHRLEVKGLSFEDNKNTNNIRFFRDGKMLMDKPDMEAKTNWRHQAIDAKKGIGFKNDKDSLVNQPFDFSDKNFMTLKDLEGCLKRVLFPDYFKSGEKFNLSSSDYNFLKKSMCALPKDYSFWANKPKYPDNYVKFLMFGDGKNSIPDHIKIYNKTGQAYGYLVDCAYIEDTSNNIGFFLTAVIHVNKNKIYNDGMYEYDEVGLPFLSKLGQAFYDYELSLKGKK